MNPVKPDIMPHDLMGKVKFTFREFFSIPEDASIKRAAIGAFLVYLPEIPAYFIPSFTQAKNTGCAKDLKQGEGIRGLVTGGLEGLAVGAIALKGNLTTKRVVPFVLLGSVLQFMSSLIMPRIGEKAGTFVYNKRVYANKINEVVEIPFGSDPTQTQLTTPNNNSPQFKGRLPYSKFPSCNLKI